MYKILSKGSFVQCTNAARGSCSGGRIIQVVAQSHDIEGEQRENRCQLSTSNATAVSFSIFSKPFFQNPNSFPNRKKMYTFFFSDNFVILKIRIDTHMPSQIITPKRLNESRYYRNLESNLCFANFSQKSNRRICFVCFFTLHGKQIKFVCSFLGRICGTPICF